MCYLSQQYQELDYNNNYEEAQTSIATYNTVVEIENHMMEAVKKALKENTIKIKGRL
ncbi:hypothetical protein B0P06_001694 [Clostridium saccharoperbutylacetonicum]|uniref:hypothetical protein n=1 Tax=Clostridium saccharoperbutylacetonicum TaxID=36745 RepID=UPI00034DDF5C|nr:hypothetical protein [Clostridium saccharoperbutylacetonicum]NRT59245.1 hypothetical protein [Clostridium saccharoperbutylacetonicum]NSB28435.1 hypothetical protein [Clostridium saccharoperbutylacetonicum]NSB41923.1 hypothetical protein [Clostridium saccharoperbutylacetonicum]